ncbi:peptidase inhibitor family I36 protein [Streptomyces laurentii]|uniref:peptidase inhibitor family I36 protein n=1 Tax=Streptomyces laurentii TaxID=39478 RepID=UPI00367C9532
MRIRRISRATAGVAMASAALLMGTMSSSASAATAADNWGDCGQVEGKLCVWEGAFTGQRAEFTDLDSLGTDCVTVPFGVQADLNMTDRTLHFYDTTDCTGSVWTIPPRDLHSWTSYGPKYSFRVAG